MAPSQGCIHEGLMMFVFFESNSGVSVPGQEGVQIGSLPGIGSGSVDRGEQQPESKGKPGDLSPDDDDHKSPAIGAYEQPFGDASSPPIDWGGRNESYLSG